MLRERSHGNGWRRVVVACVIGLSLCGVRASAQVTWDANTGTTGPQDGSGTWSTSDANWWNGSADVVWPNLTTSSAIIGANNGAAGTITTSGSLTLNAITFNAPGSGAYTLTGGTLGFAGSSPTITANAAAEIGSAITSGVGLTKSGTGTLTLSGVVSNTSGNMSISRGAVTLTGTLTNTASGAFNVGSGNGGMLTIAGGTMSTSWSNGRAIVIAPGSGQSGTIAVSGGALSASGLYVGENNGGNGAFTQSGGSATIGGGELWMAGNTSSLTVTGGSFTNNNTTRFGIGSSGISTSTISVSGSGAITLGTLQFGISGANGFTSTVNVGDGTAGGTLQVNTMLWGGATTTASTINFNSGTFVAGGSYSIPTQIATVVRGGGANISVVSARALTISNTLADGGGGGGLTKLGAGTLSLTGANTFTGATRINAGSLSIGNALALQSSTLDLDGTDAGTVSAITQNSTLGGLTGSRSLDMLTRTLSVGNNGVSTTYSGALSNGALTKIGAGTLTLTGSSSYTGATTIDSGTLQIGAGGTAGAIAGASTITGSSGSVLAFSRTDNYGGNVSNNIGGGLGLTLNSGTLTLTGSNAYAGTTTINAGVLGLGAANALAGAGNIVFAGGTLQFTSSNVGDYAARIRNSGSSIALNTNAQNVTFAGSIDSTNTGGLVKSGGGTLTLSGSNAYSGGTTLAGGAFTISNANAWGTAAVTYNVDANTTTAFSLPTSGTVANAITINKPGSNRTYYFQQNQSNNVTLGGNITVASGNGNHFTLNGVSTGTFTLTGSNSFGGDVFTSANTTFRIGGTNAAGTGVWRPDVSTKIVLLDGANFRGIMGNAIASYSMETSGTATVSGDMFNRNTANVAVNLPAGAQLTFSGNIRAEGGNTTGAYTKTGAGTWVVNSTLNQMTYNVLEGTIQVSSFSGIGPTSTASFLVLDGGTLRYTGAAASTTREFTLGANGGSLDASGSGSAAFTSTAAVSFTGSGSRTLTLTGTNTGNNTLAMAINDNGSDKVSLSKAGAGTWVLSGSNGFTGSTRIGAGTLSLGNVNALAGSMLDMDAGDAGTLAFGVSGTNTYNIGGLMGARNIATTASVVLSVGGNAASGTYAGIISGAGAFSKVGGGVLTLAGANTYTGATNVSAGTLAVNGSLANSSLTVASGATLMGSGTIAGLTTIAGLHRPGNSPGVETFTNLAYNSGANVQWELWGNTATNSPLAYDQIVVNGDLTFAGVTTLDLVFTGSAGPSSFSSVAWADPFWGTNQEWLLYDVANGTTGFASNLTLATTNWQDSTGAFFQAVRPDSTFSLEQRGSDVYVVYAAVPEPTAIALAGIGTVLVAASVLRRRRQRFVMKAG